MFSRITQRIIHIIRALLARYNQWQDNLTPEEIDHILFDKYRHPWF